MRGGWTGSTFLFGRFTLRLLLGNSAFGSFLFTILSGFSLGTFALSGSRITLQIFGHHPAASQAVLEGAT